MIFDWNTILSELNRATSPGSRDISLFTMRGIPVIWGKPQIDAFLTYLATDIESFRLHQNQAFNALMFLYRQVLKEELDDLINSVPARSRSDSQQL